MYQAYVLDKNLASLGIGREDFISPFEALISSSSSYNGKRIYDLLTPNKHYHDHEYEDEYIRIYEPYKPVIGSSVGLMIKPIKKIISVNGVSLYTQNLDIQNCGEIGHLSYELSYESSDKTFRGVFITPKCIKDTFKNIYKYHKADKIFLTTKGFIIVEHIDLDKVKQVFTKISKIPFHVMGKRF